MGEQQSTYFLGANSNQGFYSCYDTFCADDFLWVIKGGPGCGKSTFMKLIAAAAEAENLDVQYVLCSADPDSVDGVYIPAWHVGYVDGTAPHVQEVRIPGAGGAYLDLGQFYNFSVLKHLRTAILENQRRYRLIYNDIYAKLATFACPQPEADATWREFTVARFYRAITHKGLLNLYPNKCAVCDRKTVYDLAEAAWEQKNRFIEIRNPLFPNLTDGLILPDTVTFVQVADSKVDTLVNNAAERICPLLKQAKNLHDELEAIYHPYVDFEAVTALAKKHIKMLKNENIRL